MNFMTQLGLLAIILMILVILIKSNQTLEQFYMEGETQKETIEIPSFKMPEFNFSEWKGNKKKAKKSKWVYEEEEEKKEEPVARSSDTIPVEIMSGWYLEMVDNMGRSYGRTALGSFPFTIGRASDNDYVLDDLSVSGHHASIEEENGILELVDQGSLNKIMIGGRPVMRANIVDRMEVCLGNTKLRFCKEEKSAAHTAAYIKNPLMEEWY